MVRSENDRQQRGPVQSGLGEGGVLRLAVKAMHVGHKGRACLGIRVTSQSHGQHLPADKPLET